MDGPRELADFYLANLPPQVEALADAIADLEASETDAVDAVRRITHQLKGSGETYGFPDVTALAKKTLAAEDEDLADPAHELLDLLNHLTDEAPTSETRILVVDDDRLMQVIIGKTIADDDRTIQYADTGEEALWLAAGVDLILLDLFLPDIDGRDVLRRLRSEHINDDAPVIVLSGADSQLARAESLALGADAFMGKPFDQDELRALVISLLSLGHLSSGRLSAEAVGEKAGRTVPARVVVAEDDTLVATLVVDRLEREGYDVIHELDGSHALASIQQTHPDIVILDVKMPRMSGHEVLDRVRSDPDLQKTAVVLLTAMSGEHDVLRGFELGADDYLLKPFSPTELVARVNRLLDSA